MFLVCCKVCWLVSAALMLVLFIFVMLLSMEGLLIRLSCSFTCRSLFITFTTNNIHSLHSYAMLYFYLGFENMLTVFAYFQVDMDNSVTLWTYLAWRPDQYLTKISLFPASNQGWQLIHYVVNTIVQIHICHGVE